MADLDVDAHGFCNDRLNIIYRCRPATLVIWL
jgi:hypothetical protein